MWFGPGATMFCCKKLFKATQSFDLPAGLGGDLAKRTTNGGCKVRAVFGVCAKRMWSWRVCDNSACVFPRGDTIAERRKVKCMYMFIDNICRSTLCVCVGMCECLLILIIVMIGLSYRGRHRHRRLCLLVINQVNGWSVWIRLFCKYSIS